MNALLEPLFISFFLIDTKPIEGILIRIELYNDIVSPSYVFVFSPIPISHDLLDAYYLRK